MNFETLICATVLVYILIFMKVLNTHLSGFDPGRAEEIYKNKELFSTGKPHYHLAKNKMHWMDPVIYYDTIKLAKEKKLSLDNLKRTLV
jgi:hypothetical protein